MSNNQKALWNYLRRRLPRILGQLDRDFDSPTFGSFDRNYWHYKIRDFSSMIIQQGMLVVDALIDLDIPDNPLFKNKIANKWIDGGLEFWTKSQLKNGSFNEYYPYESGYPPTAFTLYTVGLILKNRKYKIDNPKLAKSINKAARWLLAHPEKEAYNQEAAGLAGLVLCSKIQGVSVDKNRLEQRLAEFYEAQNDEGWFPEYHGPDTGYLSVTIDCLFDIYDSTGDKRALNAIEKAIDYISHMISVSGETPVMINSRNTDYIVLYGLTRMAEKNPKAAAIVEKLLENIDKPDFYLNRTDDRYASHYVYQSCFRSLDYMNEILNPKSQIPCESGEDVYLEHAGIQIVHKPGAYSLFVNMKKGGIVNLFDRNGIKEVDFGFRIKYPKDKVAVSHWLDNSYKAEKKDDQHLVVKGKMSKHGWMKSSPSRHIGLRILSYLFGNRLIPVLKKVMIFGNPSVKIDFERQIEIHEDKINIIDAFKGPGLSGKELYRAPHHSLRHVSSAGQYVPEEIIEVDDDIYRLKDGEVELFISRDIRL